MTFINILGAIEKHYCRSQNNSERLYLPSTLNIKKLWKMYSGTLEVLPVKHSYLRNIFNTCYNLGFGTPRTDMSHDMSCCVRNLKGCLSFHLIVRKTKFYQNYLTRRHITPIKFICTILQWYKDIHMTN